MPTRQDLRNAIALVVVGEQFAVEQTVANLRYLTPAKACQHGNPRVIRGPPVDAVVLSSHRYVGVFRQFLELADGHAVAQYETHNRQQQVATTLNDVFFDSH
jgi:hypothetical protein